jgi:uncharacterized membrane protein YvbJ
MVYCTKCGTLNPDDANVCSKCGAPLNAGQEEARPYWRHRHHRDEYYGHARTGGGGLATLFIGIIIIVVGLTFLLSQVYAIPLNWSSLWAIIIIFVGVWLLIRAFLWRRRR